MPYVHFNSHDHRANKKDHGNRKTLVYRRTRSSKGVKCKDVKFTNASGYFCYFPDSPLKCGAVSWVFIEEGDVELVEPEVGITCTVTPKSKTKKNNSNQSLRKKLVRSSQNRKNPNQK